MTESELLVYLTILDEAINSNIEFWLSGSFAVLMAFFFAGQKIIGFIKWTLISLYVLFTLFISIRLFINAFRLRETVRYLNEMDSTFMLSNNLIGISGGVLMFTIVISGTAATIYYGLNSERLAARVQRSDT